jgi:hypothetical protein
MRLVGSIGACVVASALAVSLSSVAAAQDKTPAAPKGAATAPAGPSKADLAAAKKHYADGEKKFNAGDYAGALADFQAANEVKSTPQAERYIGLAEDNLGHPQAAAEWYDKFLAHVPEKMAAMGDDIRKRNADIKARPGKVHLETTPPGATVTVDDKPQAAPTPTDVELAPGSHKVKFTEPGRLPSEKQIDVAFASTQTVTVALDAEPPPPAAPPPPPVAAAEPPAPTPPPPLPQPRSMVPAFVTGGLAIAAAGVGTVFGIMALNDKSSYDKNPTTSTADNGDTHALISDMSFGVALTFGVTSAVLFLTKDEPPAASQGAPRTTTARADVRKKPAVTVEPVPVVGPHGGGAGVLLRF